MNKLFTLSLLFTLTSNIISMERDERDLDFPILTKTKIYDENFFSVWNTINLAGKDRIDAITNFESLKKEKDGLEGNKCELFLKYYNIFEKLDYETAIYELTRTIALHCSIHEEYTNYLKGTREIEKFIAANQKRLPLDISEKTIESKMKHFYKVIGQMQIKQLRFRNFKICWAEAESKQDKNLVLCYLMSEIMEKMKSKEFEKEAFLNLKDELSLFLLVESTQISQWNSSGLTSMIDNIKKAIAQF